MPALGSCINNVFTPGNIGTSIGTTPLVVIGGRLYTPSNYPYATVQYSLNFSLFYNSSYYYHGLH